MSRLAVACLAVLSLAACHRPEKASSAAPADGEEAESATPTPARTALVEVWRTANPTAAQPEIAAMGDAFDPRFERIANAGNDADNAFIKSTLTFLKAVQSSNPAICAQAPVARFDDARLDGVPPEAVPAFRAMLTDRLAVIADGATHAAPSEELMSGSMQGLSMALADSQALELLPKVASGGAYDPVAACAATIQAWEAFDTNTQSPQLMKAVYAGEF